MTTEALLIIAAWVLMAGIVPPRYASRYRCKLEWGCGNRPILVGLADIHMDNR